MNDFPTITFQRRMSASIEDYVNDVKKIWPLNFKRSPLHIWMEVVGISSEVGEGVRKYEWDVVINKLGKLVMWWFAFIGRLNDLSEESGDAVIFKLPDTAGDILWRNYPGICPVCVSTFYEGNKNIKIEQIVSSIGDKCHCLCKKVEVEKRSEDIKQLANKLTKEISLKYIEKKPNSLLDYEQMFAKMFESNIYILTPDEIAFHLLEEIGEVSNALVDATIYSDLPSIYSHSLSTMDKIIAGAKNRIEHIEKELSDVFSWIIAMLEKSKQIISSSSRLCVELNVGKVEKEILNNIFKVLSIPTETINLTDIIWGKYRFRHRLGHKKCRSNVCKCNVEGQLLLDNKHLSRDLKQRLAAIKI